MPKLTSLLPSSMPLASGFQWTLVRGQEGKMMAVTMCVRGSSGS